MVNSRQFTQSPDRYGVAGFFAALANTAVLMFICWAVMPWWLLLSVTALPALLVDMLIAALLSRRGGQAGQIGRGMLVGCLSAPISLAVFVPVLVLAGNIGVV
ncbi:MAG: hypothetical protein WCE30_11610 [Mycobacterium sp.]